MKDEYVKFICDKLCVVKDDLTDNEWIVINMSFMLLLEKIEDLKIANDTIKRLEIEVANLKAFKDDKDYYSEDDSSIHDDDY